MDCRFSMQAGRLRYFNKDIWTSDKAMQAYARVRKGTQGYCRFFLHGFKGQQSDALPHKSA
jgi:hypothetical protein